MTGKIRRAAKRKERDEEPIKKRKTKSVVPNKVVRKAQKDFEEGSDGQ